MLMVGFSVAVETTPNIARRPCRSLSDERATNFQLSHEQQLRKKLQLLSNYRSVDVTRLLKLHDYSNPATCPFILQLQMDVNNFFLYISPLVFQPTSLCVVRCCFSLYSKLRDDRSLGCVFPLDNGCHVGRGVPSFL